ncbi:MAG: NAD(P)H-dependent oxidoreductase subunit E [bacterium]
MLVSAGSKKQRTHKLGAGRIDKLILKYKNKPGCLLGILEEAQELNRYKYLPEETLEYIAKKTSVPLSQAYGVITFYAFFNLKPQGEHIITVCRGTACHTRGSKELLEVVKPLLDMEEISDESFPVTTGDNKFTFRTVACFGQCALAPVAEIDGKIFSHITREKLRKIIKGLSAK